MDRLLVEGVDRQRELADKFVAPYVVGNAKGNVPRSGEDGGARVQVTLRKDFRSDSRPVDVPATLVVLREGGRQL